MVVLVIVFVVLGDNGNIYRPVGTNGNDSGTFRFSFDDYDETLWIIPRAIELLDYTPGVGGIGAGDVIHGEAGDDLIHGQTGNDVLFGDGQDDNIYGGTGDDRVYGGNGVDGILGGDGIILTSRNGRTEPLHGLTTPNEQTEISLPGSRISAVLYVTGELHKAAQLLAFEHRGNDLIYGGLGNDFVQISRLPGCTTTRPRTTRWNCGLPCRITSGRH